MNIKEILQAINEFRGRKFLIALGSWWMVYVDKLDAYWAVVITVAYFILDIIEKYLVYKSEEDTNVIVAKDKSNMGSI
jgi:hypothetical protein